MSPDLLGGLIMVGGAIFQGLSIHKAYKDKRVKGVHPFMMLYFLGLNAYYVFLLGTANLVLSAYGTLLVVVTSGIWFAQYVWYEVYRPA